MEISPAKRVGKVLEILRDESGKTQADVAKEVHCDPSFISHIEKGRHGAHTDTVRAIGKAIGHERAVLELWGFVGSPGIDATADLLAGYEAEAIRISTWNTMMLHALLQTESYARAIIRTALPFSGDAEHEELLIKRMERQKAVTGKKAPLLWSVIDESILYRPYGGREVMREQLQFLGQLADKPNVLIQVMPFTSVIHHPGFEGVLGVIEFSDKTPVWYSDAWSAGKLSDDREEVRDYARYFDLIRGAALSPSDSAEFIARIGSERYDD